MKILLINSNPVVSRLTALSARKERIKLDEIKNISELKNSDYSIAFVDIESFNQEIANFLKNSNITKRVCFYTQDDKNIDKIFNFEILKPFLPSEVSAIIRDTKIEMEQEESLALDIGNSEQKEEHLNLDELISTKRDDLEPLNIIEKSVIKDENEKEMEKKLLDELIIPKENFDLEFKKQISTEKKKEPQIEDKIELKKEIEKPIDSELFVLDSDTKEDKSSKVLSFDEESHNEFDLDTQKEKSKEIKILETDEISNIEKIVNSKTSDDLSLDNIVETPIALTEAQNKKKAKKIENSQEEESKVAVDVITDTIKAMPIEELRQLLRGTKINITIEFPNDI